MIIAHFEAAAPSMGLLSASTWRPVTRSTFKQLVPSLFQRSVCFDWCR
jgi:hypothetical protein